MPAFQFENGPRAGDVVTIGPSGALVVGCLESCTLYVPDDRVIARHAQIKEHRGRYFIKDFARDTHVNGTLITTGEIREGDLVRVGNTTLTFASHAGQPQPPSRPQDQEAAPGLAGRVVGGYEILQQLGRGGMGTVYRARQLSLDREVALKILSPRLTRDAKFVEQFVREARAAGQLNHPNIVQVFDVGRAEDLFFYSMEYMTAGTVADRLDRQGQLPVDEALQVVTDAARALEYAEIKHIVHRDVKPGNLMVDELGHIKLADLGLARSLRDTAARDPQGILGTPNFISPEQAQSQSVDIRSDIYSLGATFYMLLAGSPPFKGSTAREIILKQIRDQPPSLREIRSDVPERVADLVSRMLRKAPDERPQSGSDLVAELQALSQRRGRKRRFIAMIGLIVVAATVVGALAHFSRPEPEVIIKETSTGVDPDLLVKERSRAQQLAAELEAREALTRFDQASADSDTPLAAAERARALRELAARYPGTKAGDEALAEATEISGALQRQREAEQRLEENRRQIVSGVRQKVEARLGEGRFLEAMILAADTGAGSDLAADPVIVSTRGQLIEQVTESLRTAAGKLMVATDERIASGDFQAAEDSLRRLTELGSVPASDSAHETLNGELRSVFEQLAGEARSRTTRLAEAREQRRAADLVHDRRLVSGMLQENVFGEMLIGLRFRLAAETITASLEAPRTSGYRDYMKRWKVKLERLASLHDRLLQAVANKQLSIDQIQPPGESREGRIIGLAEGASGLRLEYAVSGGRVAQNVPWEVLSRDRGLADLYGEALGLSGEPLADVGLAVVLVEESRWLRRLRPLFELLAAYDPTEGWGPTQWSLVADLDATPPDLQVASLLLERARASAPAAPRVAELAATLERESDAVKLLAKALIPYLSEDAIVGFVESGEALGQLIGGNDSSDLVALAYGHLDDGTGGIALAEEDR